MEKSALSFRILKYVNFDSWDELGYGWCIEQSARMFKELDLLNKYKHFKFKQ